MTALTNKPPTNGSPSRGVSNETIAILGVGAVILGVVVASWADSRAFQGEARTELAVTRTELKGDIASLRTELKGDMDKLRTELKGDMDKLRTELRADMGKLDDRMNKLDDRMSKLDDRLRNVELAVARQAERTATLP